MNTKRVLLYVITKSELGGAQSHVRDLIRHFHLEYEVHLAVGQTGSLTESLRDTGVKVHCVPTLTRGVNLLKDLPAVKDFVHLIDKIQPDIIHTHSSKAGVVGRVAGWLCGIPAIFTAHGWGFTPNTPRLRRSLALFAEKLLAPLTAKLICVSESDRQLALRLGVGTSFSLTTIRYGIPSVSVPSAQPAKEPPRLIMVARFNEQKDQATLLKAIAQLKQESFSLDLVGSGPSLEACKTLAETLGIADRVNFLGDRQDVPDLLARSQIFVLSTHYEGLPISILEAMRTGLPVIATSVNGIPEEVIQGETGHLVPHEDGEALAIALKTLIRSAELREQMGQASQARFLQEFTLELMLTQIRLVYQEVLSQQLSSGIKTGTASICE
ncbi:MAG: glycosyltransferase family 4 protein [Phormidesmis sp. CAN_BIN44]|nr:glycosyltransferase family 4 protein [Phormidesmis sp. CAN_BIN44]